MTIDLTQFHDAFYEESAEAIGQWKTRCCDWMPELPIRR